MSRPKFLVPDPSDHRWIESAACRGVTKRTYDPFVAERSWHPPEDALTFCDRCPVRLECLRDALALDDQFTVRAGTTPRMRRALKRKRLRVRCPSCSSDQTLVVFKKDAQQLCASCGLSWQTNATKPKRDRHSQSNGVTPAGSSSPSSVAS